MKLWGGRFEEGPSEIFEQFSGSLHFDKRLIFADIRGSQAFARALARVGILAAEEASELCAAFHSINEEAKPPPFSQRADNTHLHTLVIPTLYTKTALPNKFHPCP